MKMKDYFKDLINNELEEGYKLEMELMKED